MRSLLAILVLACGSPQSFTDAGNVDAGADAVTCTPGASFCAEGMVWECTLTGHDGVLLDLCRRGDQWRCSDTPCAGWDGGSVYLANVMQLPAFYCCP